MIDNSNEVLSSASKRDQQLTSSMEKIFSAAQVNAVFSEPVVCGNYTVITASEVSAGGGFGSGMGIGPTGRQSGEASQAQEANGGGGIGAGGTSRGRPVAAIVIGPDGVKVQPVIDVTKVALSGIAFAVSIVALLRKVLK
ncbi:MAG: hypothetical protein ABI465_11760 [Ktedonobacteraceae bacterium]